jgi:hypothetical protein
VNGGCHCGNIRLEITLTGAPETYQPRACDCDFCVKHAAAYVSDANGELRIYIANSGNTARYRQGSAQAEFLVCRECGVLVAVLLEDTGRVYGTVNARAVDANVKFGNEQPVSPKALAADAKVTRWRKVWFANVAIREGG